MASSISGSSGFAAPSPLAKDKQRKAPKRNLQQNYVERPEVKRQRLEITTSDLLAANLAARQCVHGYRMYCAEHLNRCIQCIIKAMFGEIGPDDLPPLPKYSPKKQSQTAATYPAPPVLDTTGWEDRPAIYIPHEDSGDHDSWSDNVSNYWVEEPSEHPGPLSASPSPPPTGDSEREDYVLAAEKTTEDDAYTALYEYTTRDWWDFSEVAQQYASLVPRRDRNEGL